VVGPRTQAPDAVSKTLTPNPTIADLLQIRFFGGPKDAGSGDLKAFEASLKAGTIDEVYLHIRWNSHSTTNLVRRLCRERSIPCKLLHAGASARLKGEYDESVSSISSSDDEGDVY
jgi:hypothetical protein